jgi:hypothetical protein
MENRVFIRQTNPNCDLLLPNPLGVGHLDNNIAVTQHSPRVNRSKDSYDMRRFTIRLNFLSSEGFLQMVGIFQKVTMKLHI